MCGSQGHFCRCYRPPPPYVRENGVIRDEKMGTEVTDLGCGGQVLAEPGL